MKTRSLIIKRFALGPLAQWGFVAGLLVACLPAFVCSWIFFSAVQFLRNLVSGWRDVGVDVLGQRLSVNLVDTLNLQQLLKSLTDLTVLGVFGILLSAVVIAIVLGLFGAFVLTLVGIFYNATGRVQFEVEEVERDAQAD